MEITIGWWLLPSLLLPSLLTVLVWSTAWRIVPETPRSGMDWDIGRGLGVLVFLGLGLLGTLSVWLVYFGVLVALS